MKQSQQRLALSQLRANCFLLNLFCNTPNFYRNKHARSAHWVNSTKASGFQKLMCHDNLLSNGAMPEEGISHLEFNNIYSVICLGCNAHMLLHVISWSWCCIVTSEQMAHHTLGKWQLLTLKHVHV